MVISCIISRQHHKSVIGRKGFNVQALSKNIACTLYIEFPNRAVSSAAGVEMGAGNHGDNGESAIKDSTDPCDSIFIRGKEENCLRANKALLHLVATNIAVDVPFRLQCAMIVGKRSKWMRFICNKYWVWIEIPHPELQKGCGYMCMSGVLSQQNWSHPKVVPRTTFVRQNWSPGPFLSVKLGPGRTHFVRQKLSYPCKNDPTRTVYQGRRNNPGCPGCPGHFSA